MKLDWLQIKPKVARAKCLRDEFRAAVVYLLDADETGN
jgi:hypothetical protein